MGRLGFVRPTGSGLTSAGGSEGVENIWGEISTPP